MARVGGDTGTEVAVPVDAIKPVLNPVQQADLDAILRLTPAHRRMNVVMAFCGLELPEWASRSGMERHSVTRWLTHQTRMPFGAGFRLAAVIGVDTQLLFAAYI